MSRYEFIRAEKACFPNTVLCRTLEVARAGCYAWLRRDPRERDRRRAELDRKVSEAHTASRGTYGSPRVTRQLRRAGETVSAKTVAKSMRRQRLRARRPRRVRRTTDSRHTRRIAPNRLARDFTTARPDEVWVTDVTALRTHHGWVCLAAIIDLCARRVVGWALSATNDTAWVVTALQRAIALRRTAPGLIHHSDRGSP